MNIDPGDVAFEVKAQQALERVRPPRGRRRLPSPMRDLGWLAWRVGMIAWCVGMATDPWAARAEVFHYSAADLGQEIPDGGGLGTFFQCEATGLPGGIVDVRVSVNLSGSWGGDLYAYLNHGDGHAVLLNRVGKTASQPLGYGVPGFQVTFTDRALNGDIHRLLEPPIGVPLPNLSQPLTGEWAPDGRNIDPDLVLDTDARTATLSALDGLTANGQWTLFVADMAAGSVHVLNGWDLTVTTAVAEPAVVGRLVFYNQSAFDGNDAAANAADDGAIAADKAALRAGETAGFTNYTAYVRGLNGIMIDIQHLPGQPTAADFGFRTGNVDKVSDWTVGPAPSSVTVRRAAGVGGSDRVTLVWGDDAVKKRWLEVTVLANAVTGLATADVFYFGNAIGESGNHPGVDAIVNASDEILARLNPRSLFNPAAVTSEFDFNRDKQVNATDQIVARINTTSAFTALRLITPSAAPATAMEPALAALAGGGGTASNRPDSDRLVPATPGESPGTVSAAEDPAAEEAPRLVLERLPDDRIRVRWPGVEEDGWSLEMTTGDGVWVPVGRPGVERAEPGSWIVDSPQPGAHRLFRGVRQASSPR